MAASYWPCLRSISASSLEWLKNEEGSPDLPQMIQLVKSWIELLISCGLGRHLEERRVWPPGRLCMFSKRIKANVKWHFPSFSFHDLLPILLSGPRKKQDDYQVCSTSRNITHIRSNSLNPKAHIGYCYIEMAEYTSGTQFSTSVNNPKKAKVTVACFMLQNCLPC